MISWIKFIKYILLLLLSFTLLTANSLNKSLNKFSIDLFKKLNKNEDKEKNDQLCEECSIEDESVRQNSILIGFKICESCRISKTIFPF